MNLRTKTTYWKAVMELTVFRGRLENQAWNREVAPAVNAGPVEWSCTGPSLVRMMSPLLHSSSPSLRFSALEEHGQIQAMDLLFSCPGILSGRN